MSALQVGNAEGLRGASTGAGRLVARAGANALLLTVFLVLMIAGAGEIGWRPQEGSILLAASLVALLPMAVSALRRHVRNPRQS